MTTQAQALADFSVRLAAGSYWPVCVEKDEQVAEGMYWIAQVQGPAERLVDGMQYAGQTFDAGFIVVKVKWLQLHAERADRSRVYKLSRAEQVVTVSAFIRVEKPLKLKEDEDGDSDHLTMIKILTAELMEIGPDYKCGHCGFPARSLHWQCPACKHWNTVKPLPGPSHE